MEDIFLIPVNYNNAERQFEATLQVLGYIHRFHVDVDGMDVIFERDEEGNYRAIIPPETPGKLPSTELLQRIAEAIAQILA
ncbi:hypothetical protein Q4E93_11010 [Flavitalea sp. BT771]|uniref:hypothetical protein n=1 Tax=Flavitalea sp. BT771 TaxID=3063329 RepID=UPI0026E1A115|nr:hypothetical protein [Flavitalea sp. BT771]MDO6431121.1 hypothetical protein [Flavitalea sp. BT771]MDV6220028.1 hypothetical protein [Flavitalea sp. BT771]